MLGLVGQVVSPLRPGGGQSLVFWPLAPELVLVGVAMFLMLFDSFRPGHDQRPVVAVTLVGILGAAAASIYLWSWTTKPGRPTSVLGNMVAADHFALFLRLTLLGVALLAVLLSYQYIEGTGEYRTEYYPLLLFATAGMTLFVSANDLIVVFLALEILSLSLYLMTGFSFRRLGSAEASMKYFLLGAFSSAFFLYGIAMAYGATGTTNLSGIAHALTGQVGTAALA